MNAENEAKHGRAKLIWWGTALVLVLGITGIGHWRWLRHESALHGVPLCFLTVLVLLAVRALLKLAQGMWRHGRRWLATREAWRMLCWNALFCVSLVMLFYSVELWRGKRAWARMAAAAAQQGFPLDAAGQMPAAVPDEQNIAKIKLLADLSSPDSALVQAHRRGQVVRDPRYKVLNWGSGGGDVLGPWLGQQSTWLRSWLAYCYIQTDRAFPKDWDKPPAPGQAETDALEAATALMAELKPYADDLEQLRTNTHRPYFRIPVDQRRLLIEVELTPALLKGYLRLARVRASAELAVRENDRAFQDALLALQLLNYLRQQPGFPWVQRLWNFDADVVQPVWEGLRMRRWNEAQLAALQRQLEAMDFLADFANSRRTDVLALAGFVECVIPTGTPVVSTGQWQWPGREAERTLQIVRWLYPVGWSLQDQAAIYNSYLRLPPADLAKGLAQASDRVSDEAMFASSDPFYFIYLLPKVRHTQGMAARESTLSQTLINLAKVACALERYRLAQGQYPAQLRALSPQYLRQVPQDLFGGQPLHYRPINEGRYVLYSCGWNDNDDGGKPPARHSPRSSYLDFSQTDVVWGY